jgi:tetratricopeptide (TPR) repeat protein
VVNLLRRRVVNLVRPEVVSLHRREVVNLSVFSSQDCDSISKEAYKFYKIKDYENACRLYELLQKRDSLLDKDFFILGLIKYKQSDISKAIAIFDKLSKKSNKNIKARFWLANSYCKLDSTNSYAIAKNYFKDFVDKAKIDTAKNGNELFISYYYFSSYFKYSDKVNYDSAIYYANKMIYITPNNIEHRIKGFLMLSIIYSGIGKIDVAKFYANKVLELDPKNNYAIAIRDSYIDKVPYDTKNKSRDIDINEVIRQLNE